MRLFSSSCLLYRHSVLARTWNTYRVVNIPSRASSLSAIHRGLRDSEKARPQGFKPTSLATSASRPARRAPTSRSRQDPDWTPPSFKIKRGKKDVTDQGPKPKSRRARFNDPTESFGKKSTVYQMKHGDLRGKMAELGNDRPPRNDRGIPTRAIQSGERGGPGRLSQSQFMQDFDSSPGRSSQTDRGSRGGRTPLRASRGKERGERDTRPRSSFAPSSFSKDRGTSSNDLRSFRDRRSSFSDDGERPHRPDRSDRFDRSSRPDRSRFDGNRSVRDKPGMRDDSGSFRDRRPAYTNNTERPSRPDRPRLGSSKDLQGGRSGTHEDFRSPRDQHSSDRSSVGESYRPPPGQNRNVLAEREPPRRRFGDRNGETEDRRGAWRDEPVRLHHTTAVSQFLYGRSVVEAALKDSRRQLYRLYVYGGEDRHNVSQDIALEKLAERKDVPIEKVKRDGLPMMDKMSGGRPHNGCVLEASPLPQLPLKALGSVSEDPARPGFSVELLHQSEEEAKVNGTADFVSYNLPAERKPFVLLLDGILDPGNLGAILRTAAFMGVNAVAITKHSSATMTAVALKASAGASEVLTLFSVNSTIDFLTRSKESGWMVYAAVPGTKRSRGNSHVTLDRVESYDPLSIQPTILVVGSEGEGLAKPVRREADLEVSIPSRSGFLSAVDSLNVSVATGVLCSAFLKKQSSGIVEIEDPTEDKEGNESQLW